MVKVWYTAVFGVCVRGSVAGAMRLSDGVAV